MCPCYWRNDPYCRCPAASSCGDSACKEYTLCACVTSACAAVGSSSGWCEHVLSLTSSNVRYSASALFSNVHYLASFFVWRQYLVVIVVLLSLCLKKQLIQSVASQSYCNNKTRKLCVWEVAWLNTNEFRSGVLYYSGCYWSGAQY